MLEPAGGAQAASRVGSREAACRGAMGSLYAGALRLEEIGLARGRKGDGFLGQEWALSEIWVLVAIPTDCFRGVGKGEALEEAARKVGVGVWGDVSRCCRISTHREWATRGGRWGGVCGRATYPPRGSGGGALGEVALWGWDGSGSS